MGGSMTLVPCCRRLAAALLIAAGAVALGAAAWPIPAGVKTMAVNGYDLAYVEEGKGEVLVLLHGASNDLRSFQLQMKPLGEKFRTISVSLRHYWPEPWSGDGEFSSEQQ